MVNEIKEFIKIFLGGLISGLTLVLSLVLIIKYTNLTNKITLVINSSKVDVFLEFIFKVGFCLAAFYLLNKTISKVFNSAAEKQKLQHELELKRIDLKDSIEFKNNSSLKLGSNEPLTINNEIKNQQTIIIESKDEHKVSPPTIKRSNSTDTNIVINRTPFKC